MSTLTYIAAVALISTAAYVLANYPNVKEISTDLYALIPAAIEKSMITVIDPTEYVRRDFLEKGLQLEFGTPATGQYTVVYGAKGVGKSEGVNRVAKGKKGVIKVDVTSANSKEEMVAQVVKALLKPSGVSTTLDMTELLVAVARAKIVPTLVFDVERAGSRFDDTVLLSVRSLAKSLAQHCHVIIILSEANAVLEFGRDVNRENFLFVDEFTREEAHELLTRLKFESSERDRTALFTAIGTNPAMLLKLVHNVPTKLSLYQFIEEQLMSAESDLDTFAHKPILKALQKHPEGVRASEFKNIRSEGVALNNPRAVGAAMKTSNAVLFHEQSRMYKLMSTAHKTALHRYKI